jgi:hypothetical protein
MRILKIHIQDIVKAPLIKAYRDIFCNVIVKSERCFTHYGGIGLDSILLIIVILLTFIVSNYISLIYGLRLGKALQKDIPSIPVEPIVKASKKIARLARDKCKKQYVQKKESKEEYNFWD